jgi:hypothetical protein
MGTKLHKRFDAFLWCINPSVCHRSASPASRFETNSHVQDGVLIIDQSVDLTLFAPHDVEQPLPIFEQIAANTFNYPCAKLMQEYYDEMFLPGRKAKLREVADKPLSCDVCGTRYKTENGLTKHHNKCNGNSSVSYWPSFSSFDTAPAEESKQ